MDIDFSKILGNNDSLGRPTFLTQVNKLTKPKLKKAIEKILLECEMRNRRLTKNKVGWVGTFWAKIITSTNNKQQGQECVKVGNKITTIHETYEDE